MDKKNILIVHNNEENLVHIQSSLRKIFNIFTMKKKRDIIAFINEIPRPNIIFIYKNPVNSSAIDFLKVLSQSLEFRDIAVIFLSDIESSPDKVYALKEGAVDYVTPPFIPDEIIAKIESIINYKERCIECNNIRIETEILESLKDLDIEHKSEYSLEENVYTKYGITLREREIIDLLCEGLLNKEISNSLYVSKRTVEFHIHNIYNKFNVKNRIELLKIINNNL